MREMFRRRTSRRAMVRALVLACGCFVVGAADHATAADVPREAHGMADNFAAPGLALAWAVVRGASEATTFVVVRIVTDPARYAWISVIGIDPFSKGEQPLRPPTPSPGATDVRAPRSHFADFPRTEFRLYDGEAGARSGAPTLVVFYLGVPDTTPEFATEDKLEAYLADRIARIRGAGGKAP
ncbi:MAG: hypothetical protein ABI981_08710 [Betaproteobacteria bacterium]